MHIHERTCDSTPLKQGFKVLSQIMSIKLNGMVPNNKCVLLRCSPSYKCESLQRCLLEQQNGVENVDLQHKTLK